MRKIAFILLFIVIGIKSQAQINTDTLWFDANWKKTSKSNAEYFRPPLVHENYWYVVKDYFITGELQMEAHSVTGEADEFDGLVIWYNQKGKVVKKTNYQLGKREGESISIVNGKKYKSINKNNRFYSGTIFYENPGGYYKVEGESGFWTNQKVFFDDEHKHLRMEQFYNIKDSTTFNNEPYKILYYDFDGNKIGEVNYDKEQVGNGEYVYYFEGENSQRIKSIHHVKNGRTIYSDLNYPNGNPKIKGVIDGDLIMTYYNEKGNVIDSLIIRDQYPFEGCQVIFSSFYDKNGHYIKEKSWFKNGAIVKNITYFPNGEEFKKTEYENQFNVKKHEIEKDSVGHVINELFYKNGQPYEGSIANKYEKKIYKSGKQIEWIEYYSDGKTIFKHKKKSQIVFYSLKNEILGKLLTDTTMWSPPIEGKEFKISNDKIYEISEYENSFVVKQTEFEYSKDLIFKTEVFFEKTDNNYNNKIRELSYFSNGNKKSEIFYLKGYSRTKGYFFNKKGDQISTYSFQEKNGTNYEYFDKSDVVRVMKTYENGQVLKEKKYKKRYKENSSEEFEIVLIYEIDVDSKAIFYDEAGNYISELSFRNRKPFTGTVFDEYGNKSMQFLEGKKHGKAITYKIPGNYKDIKDVVNYVNDKREGLKEIYNYHGKLEKTEMYKDDKLNGNVITYLKDGSKTKVIYKNGQPYEGEIVDLRYGKRSVLKEYKGGDLIYKIKYLETGDIKYFYESDKIRIEKYYSSSDKIKYSLTQLKDKLQLTGAVIRFNEKGKEMHRAVLENNKLISGEIWLGSTGSYSIIPENRYLKVAKTKTKTELKMFNENHEIQFSIMEINAVKNSLFERKVNYELDYITEERLY